LRIVRQEFVPLSLPRLAPAPMKFPEF
jgi:hypothetical protein